MTLQFHANDESDTDRFGAALAQALPPGAVVALIGTLGAGKTRLVQAVAKAIGIDSREVVSPTFVLVHEYPVRVQGSGFRVQNSARPKSNVPSPKSDSGDVGPWTLDLGPNAPDYQPPVRVIYHLDAYRIRDDDEFRGLGPEEYLESDGWTFVEWADRIANCLPREYLQITIEVTGPTERRFTVASIGERLRTTVETLRTTVPSNYPND